ncbi:hypothetical protein M441DRAFT_127777 [Trichoderma asperellum CBS 433.97]|uniref:F-box domain-containing protein n=1 Tax=Trichoderma asperellum (strain ATCC 204424 / CBS 433.97 / NBRC 101777) TaxID=1042311 RepID=A0A2T3ZNI4_TRIA4|nr:hypothetical protein M441DRAFT_127777 [Trichoderma asperellum CBS 433.97]PTB46344.1 hypothetical protein M441DRAFT_127777 [Trichoderma asperellum CBS 433.97]
MSLCQVPSEILRLIIENLDPDDLLQLASTSRHFKHIIHDKFISRKVLESIPFSLDYKEGRKTGDYDKALRKRVKRRNALRMAKPFHILEVSSEAVHFTYANGALCYTTKQTSPGHEHRLRVLLLQGSPVQEINISVLQLICDSDISDFDENRPYQFKPLYHADGIVSCLYEQRKPPSRGRWLIIYSIEKGKILQSKRLCSTANIFVRNNHRYLYYGTKSEPFDGQRRWVLHGFSLEKSEWLPRRVILWDLAGSDIGSTVCFEIFDDHLYGVSSQELTELEDTEWTAPGHPLNSFYYAFRFRLGDHSTVEILPRSALWRRGATDGPIDDRWNHLQLGQDEKSGQISVFETRKEWLCSWSRRSCYGKQLLFPAKSHSGGSKTDDQCYEGWNDTAHHETSLEDTVHRGDNGFSSLTFDLRNSPVRSYSPSCQAFVDIVSTTTTSTVATKRLRLREISFWPADRGNMPSDGSPDSPLDRYIDGLLNPQAYFDEVEWATDERVVVYSPKTLNQLNEPRSVVLISFDPALNFEGLCCWDEYLMSPHNRSGKSDFHAECIINTAMMNPESTTCGTPRVHGLDLSHTIRSQDSTRKRKRLSTSLPNGHRPAGFKFTETNATRTYFR